MVNRIPMLRPDELTELKMAFNDALNALDFAASEGFEWPTDPITPGIKAVLKRYGTATDVTS